MNAKQRKPRPRIKIEYRHGWWDVGPMDANGEHSNVPHPVEPPFVGGVQAWGIRGIIVYKGDQDDVCYWEVCEDAGDLPGTLFTTKQTAKEAFEQEFRDHLQFEIYYRRTQGEYRD